MKYALLKALIVGLLIILPLPALMSAPGVQDSKVVRVVVGYEDEGVIGKLATTPGIDIIKILQALRAVVLLTPLDKLDSIKSLEGVRYVEEDGVARALEISAYSDVLWNVRMINATDVWDSYYDTYGWSALGKGVVIAVLDTGIDYRHSELQGKVLWCAKTFGPRTYMGFDLRNCMDRNAHGTHVAGIIASTINNVGNAGVAPSVTLYAVKVLNDGGLGFYSDVAEGIVLAVKGPDGVPGTSDDARITPGY